MRELPHYGEYKIITHQGKVKRMRKEEGDFISLHIKSMKVNKLKSVNNKAYLIEDLTTYINVSHTIEIDSDLKTVLSNSGESESYPDAHAFGIVLDDVKEKDN